jgi:hypothetical protein
MYELHMWLVVGVRFGGADIELKAPFSLSS